MTLSEIETILEELVVRHNNLTTELLTTLLLSAGWEDKNVKEAQLLFKQRGNAQLVPASVPPVPAPIVLPVASPVVAPAIVVAPVVPVPITTDESKKEDLTFFQPDGNEEQTLPDFKDEPNATRKNENELPLPRAEIFQEKIATEEPKVVSALVAQDVSQVSPPLKEIPTLREEPLERYKEVDPLIGERKEEMTAKESEGVFQNRPPVLVIKEKEKVVVTPPIFKEPEIQSLVVHEEPIKERSKTKESEIPANLPLLPFERSPHVWSFSRYKNVFHGDDPATIMKIEPVQKEKHVYVEPVVVPVKAPIIIKEKQNDEEISVEKMPLTKGDESLVFLAGVMLLVIIVILGYMYSNGRL